MSMPLAPGSHQDALPRSVDKFTALFSWALRILDIVVLLVTGLLALWLRFGHFEMPNFSERAITRALLFAVLVFGNSDIYRSWRGRSLAMEIFQLVALWATVFALNLLYMAIFKQDTAFSRLWLAYWFIGTVAGSTMLRLCCRGAARWVRSRGLDLRTAVIVGGNADANRIFRSFAEHRSAGIDVRGWFSTSVDTAEVAGLRHFGTWEKLVDYVQEHRIDSVWIALPMSAQEQIEQVLGALEYTSADVKFVPDLFGMRLFNHSMDQVAGLPVLNLRASPMDGHARLVKAIEDRVLAVLILVLISPLMLLIAVAVKLTSPGPVLFRQLRHGLRGREIEVWKFRSMRVHEEAGGQVTQATKGDPRITPLGRFLRRTSLDELPQFFNVLRGEMSIVGPRPHALAHNDHYKNVVQDYMQRHMVKPGITGWAQVNGLRGETETVEKMAARVEYDLYYLQNWSLWFDLRIIAMTVVKGFMGRNAY